MKMAGGKLNKYKEKSRNRIQDDRGVKGVKKDIREVKKKYMRKSRSRRKINGAQENRRGRAYI